MAENIKFPDGVDPVDTVELETPVLIAEVVDNKIKKITLGTIIDYIVNTIVSLFSFYFKFDSVDELRNISSAKLLMLKTGVVKGVTLVGYYTKEDTPAPIDYYISNTDSGDDGGSVIEVGGIKLEHEFIGEINLRYFGLTGNESQDCYHVLDNILAKAIDNKLNIKAPKGVYNSFVRNMPFRNTENNNGLRDFNGISLIGEGRQTIFKSSSVTGADVFQLNAIKSFRLKNLSVTADISDLTHSGSNGVSVTNGFDDVEIIDVHCFDLPSVPYPDPAQNYLDGGKAFTIQSSKGNTNYHGSIKIIGTAENVGYGFGHDGYIDDLYAKNIVADINVSVKRCFRGVAMAFAGPTESFTANDKSINYNLNCKIEDSQIDITMNRVFGGDYSYNILSTLENDVLKTNPLTGQPWLSSRPNSVAFNLAPVKNCNIKISGYKKICDQKGAIGSVGSISEPLYDGSTRMANIDINLTGSYTSDMTVNTNAEGKNIEHCNIEVSNFNSLPNILFDTLKNNSVMFNGIPYSSKQNTKEIFFKRQPSDAETLRLMIHPSGMLDLTGQRNGSVPDLALFRLWGYNGSIDSLRFAFFNGGRVQITNSDNISYNILSGMTLPEGNIIGTSGDIYIRIGESGGVRISGSIWFKQSISGNTGWVRLDNVLASTTVAGLVKQASNVALITTPDATDLATNNALTNAIKLKLNDLITKLTTSTVISNL